VLSRSEFMTSPRGASKNPLKCSGANQSIKEGILRVITATRPSQEELDQ
jgi:hypothetical protein